MKFRVLVAVVIFFAALGLFGSYGSRAEGKNVAAVNGVGITEQRLEEAVNALFPREFYHSSMTPEKKNAFKPKVLQGLIERELFYQEAMKRGYEIKRSERDAAIKGIRGRFRTKAEFESAVRSNGYTMETFESSVEKDLVTNKFINEEITKKSAVSDDFVREHYDKNKEKLMRPGAIRVRHILIKVEPGASKDERELLMKKAEEVLKKAKAGEDFAGLAYKNSMDEWSIKGGDLGLVHRGRLDAELEEAAFKLEPGEISGIIKTIYGYHILKVEEKIPPTQVGFDEIKEKLKKKLQEENNKNLHDGILNKLKESAKIEIY